mmetsp:Transcript_15431/g.27022  ORF Transcript_15431/g.27022 Transcript_15431/m.27022 type:complete len:1020 (+) Transcript_15431:135-3194(+)
MRNISGVLPVSSTGKPERRLPPVSTTSVSARTQGAEFVLSATDSSETSAAIKEEAAAQASLQRRRGPSSIVAGRDDIVSKSMHRRDMALAERPGSGLGTRNTLPQRPLPSSLLKKPASGRGGAIALTPMAADQLSIAPRASPETVVSPTPSGADEELRRLRQDLKLRDAELQRTKADLQRSNQDYEGCKAFLAVTKAELSLCQENLEIELSRQHMKPKALMQGAGWLTQPEDIAAEVAAHAVAQWIARGLARKSGQEAVAWEQTMESERLERKRQRAERKLQDFEAQAQKAESAKMVQNKTQSLMELAPESGPKTASPDELMRALHGQTSTTATADTGSFQPNEDKTSPEQDSGQQDAQLDPYLQDSDDPLLASFGVGQAALQLGLEQDREQLAPSPDTGGTPTPGPRSQSRAIAEPGATVADRANEMLNGKELTMAREEIRILKVVVQNSKREIQFYNNALREARKEHAEDMADVQAQLEAEKTRSAEEMKHWRTHVKKEQVNDPNISIALRKWQDELTVIKAYQAFVEWRRRTLQVKLGRTWSSKFTLLVEMVSCFSDWKDQVLRNKAERVAKKLHGKWFRSVEVVLQSWGMESAKGMLRETCKSWSWEVKRRKFQEQSSSSIKRAVQRWLMTCDDALVQTCFSSWQITIVEDALKAFQRKLPEKLGGFSQAVLALSGDGLNVRVFFWAWKQALTLPDAVNLKRRFGKEEQVLETCLMAMTGEQEEVAKLLLLTAWADVVTKRKTDLLSKKFSQQQVKDSVFNAMVDWGVSSKELMMATAFNSWKLFRQRQALYKVGEFAATFILGGTSMMMDAASVKVIFMTWHRRAKRSHIVKQFAVVFRPEKDLVPVIRAWSARVRRSFVGTKMEGLVRRKECERDDAIVYGCLNAWRSQRKPGRLKPETLQRVEVDQERRQALETMLVTLNAWASQALKAKVEAAGGHLTKANELVTFQEKADQAEANLKQRDEALKRAQADKEADKKALEALEAKRKALEAEKQKLEEDVKAASQSKCCVMM